MSTLTILLNNVINNMITPFNELCFYHCYDCGYGEKGVHDNGLNFEQAYYKIVERTSKETADKWAAEEDHYFEFRPNSYMIAEPSFDEENWVGSDDY